MNSRINREVVAMRGKQPHKGPEGSRRKFNRVLLEEDFLEVKI